jgi:integrase
MADRRPLREETRHDACKGVRDENPHGSHLARQAGRHRPQDRFWLEEFAAPYFTFLVRPREYLTADEVEHLIKAARSRGGRYGHRDAAMLLLAYRHELRVGELVGARWDQCELGRGFFTFGG